MLVGEQPGDKEDQAGTPFVGPAGRLLDRALVESGISRDEVYLTNAVKHFKWEPRGRVRLHKKPSSREIVACAPWLEAEIAAVRPFVIVGLGTTATRALLGRPTTLASQRGRTVARTDGTLVVVTLHPSAVLRATGDNRIRAHDQLVEDLGRAKSLVESE